jgi:hypothetical protein
MDYDGSELSLVEMIAYISHPGNYVHNTILANSFTAVLKSHLR